MGRVRYNHGVSSKTNTLSDFKRIILFLGVTVMLIGLGLFIYLSYYNRYWADDWCYNADLRIKGFWETLRGYFYDTTYTPSRYSVTIFAGLLQIFKVAGVQWMTPLTIIFWLVGLIWLFINITRLAGFQTDSALITLISAFIIYFSIYLTPQLYQSLYWRTGLLTYTTPIVLWVWIFAIITYHGLSDRSSHWQFALAGLLAWLAGGCSEAAATVLASSLIMYLGAAWVYRKQIWAQRTWRIAGVALIFAIIAMCLLIFSPTTQIRGARYGASTPLLQLPRLIYSYTYSFFVLTVKDKHHILMAMIAALAGFAYPIFGSRSFKFNKYILLDLFVVAVTVLLVAASLTPSIYVEKGLPAPRTMIIPRFIAAFGFVFGGWVAGASLRENFQDRWLQTGAAILLLISLLFPIYTIRTAANHWMPIFTARTQAWDVRDMAIRSALTASEPRVTVQDIDGLPVGGIRDFDPPSKKGYWITLCASDYYNIKFDVVVP